MAVEGTRVPSGTPGNPFGKLYYFYPQGIAGRGFPDIWIMSVITISYVVTHLTISCIRTDEVFKVRRADPPFSGELDGR